MKKKYSFEFLKEVFEEWFEYKADEIYDSGKNAANIWVISKVASFRDL